MTTPAVADGIWVVVPVYNNAATVADVVRGALQHVPRVLVVDDGSTDLDVEQAVAGEGVTVLRHETNRGKGVAIRTALEWLSAREATWMITIDADGQHSPEDLPTFLHAIEDAPDAIIVGARDFSHEHVPGKSRFGRKFSNMWIRLECGAHVDDSQSGYRAYPVGHCSRIRLRGEGYELEVEILVRAVWHGLEIRNVPVRVWYPENPEERVTSFRPFADNRRIAHMHNFLIHRRLFPIPHEAFVERPSPREELKEYVRHPIRTTRKVLRSNASPGELAAAAAVGTILAILPRIGMHTVAILYVAGRLHLNLPMAVSIQHFYAPPVVPLLCIELGHFMARGEWLVPDSWQSVFSQLHIYFVHWFLGSLVLAPLFAVLAALAVHAIASAVHRRRRAS